MPVSSHSRRLALLALPVSALLAVAACGSSTPGASSPAAATPATATSAAGPTSAGGPTAIGASTAPTSAAGSLGPVAVDPAAAALLPAKYKAAGVLKASTDATYAPNEFVGDDGTTIMGFDVDLGNAIAAKLGVKATFTSADFDGILTGIQAGRYDWSLSSFTDNLARQKTVDFVDYFTAGTSILVKKGNPEKITTLTDLCGKNVAMESGTVQVTIAAGAMCPSGTKINVTQLKTDSDARVQVTTGRAVADMNDFPVAEYYAKTSGGGNDFEVVGEQYESAPYGIACSKGTGLDTAVQAALKSLVADGTYAAILAKWDIAQGSLTSAMINGGTGSGS